MSKTLELFESIQNHLNEPEDLDSYWQKNYQKIIDFVDEAGPEYIADLIYDGDIEIFNQNTGKQVALDLLHQLGIKELENELKMLNESEETNSNIESVIPNYTGGGIYTYIGKLSDGNYFMAEDSIFDKTNPIFSIRIVNENPDEVGEDSWYPEWQEEHLVKDVVETDNEAKEFTKQILQWIITNKPEGNYDISDMETMKNVLDNINESEIVENKN